MFSEATHLTQATVMVEITVFFHSELTLVLETFEGQKEVRMPNSTV